MKIRLTLVVAATLLFIANGHVFAQSTAPCGCADVPDLINRLNIINASIDALKPYKPGPNEMTNDILPEPNPTRQTRSGALTSAIQQSIALANNGQARRVYIQLSNTTCKSTVKGDTPCLESVAQNLASMMQNLCESEKSTRKLGPNDDVMNFMPFSRYVATLRGAYLSEVLEIQKRLRAMPKSCRPGDWFGTVTVVETKTMVVTISVPGTDKMNQGTEEITNDTTIRNGGIRFDGRAGSTPSSWTVGGKLTRTNQHKGMVDCDTTPLKEQFVAISSGLHTEIRKSGSASLPMDVAPDESEDGRKIKIVFQIPAVNVFGALSETDVVMGGCPGMARNERRSSTSEYTLSAVDVESTASVFPGDPQKVSGSEPLDLVPRGFSVPGTTLTHTVIVTYHLYKFR